MVVVVVMLVQATSESEGSLWAQLAKMYVVAHEYGHHIQHLSGTMHRADRSQVAR